MIALRGQRRFKGGCARRQMGRRTPYPPIILKEYQRKRLTKKEFRKCLIQKNRILVGLVSKGRNGRPEKEKAGGAPAFMRGNLQNRVYHKVRRSQTKNG